MSMPKLTAGPAYRLKQGVRWQGSRPQDWEPILIASLDRRSSLYCGQVTVDGELHFVFASLAPNVRYKKNSRMRYYAQKA